MGSLKKIILFLIFTSLPLFPEITNVSHDKGDKCGTFLSLEQRKIILSALCDKEDSLGRCIQQKTFLSPSGKFLIHYDTSGRHAVNLTDSDQNNIPDYIDSVAYYFDYAYKVEVDSIGYIPPATDNGRGGSDAYDVYVFNMGDYHVNPNPMYGQTFPDIFLNNQRKFKCYATYTFIDNDFSPYDSTIIGTSGDTIPTFTETGLLAMKITAAHEFHHAIQFNYGISEPGTGSLYEMTSTWMENRLFPESKDYISYLKMLFKNPEYYPFGIGDDNIGYKYSIVGQYGYIKFGDVILKRMWELIGSDISGYRALDSSYKEKGSGFVKEWCGFLPWLYYTGSRAKTGQYFPSANEYPELSFFSQHTFTSPSLTDNGFLKSFEFRAFRYILPTEQNKSDDTLDIIITNPDLMSAILQDNKDKPYNITCTGSEQSGMRRIGDTKYFYRMVAEEGYIVDSLFFSSGSVFYHSSPVFPNPFKTSKHDKLYFPVPANSLTNDKVMLKIYKTDMDEVLSRELEISVEQNIKVAVLDNIPPEITSGVYIFSIEYKGSKDFGKVVIIRD